MKTATTLDGKLIMKLAQAITAVTCIAVLSMYAMAATANADEVKVDRRTLLEIEGDNASTLVVQLQIEVPRSDEADMTRLSFRWYDKTSITIANGILDQAETVKRATILIVAQSTAATDEHPAMLLLSTQQESSGAAQTVQAYVLDSDVAMSDVIALDIKSGSYDLYQPIQIGTLGGAPIVLSIEPPFAE